MSRNPTERFPGPTVTELGTKVTGSGQAGCARVSTPDHAKGQPQPDTGPRSASKIARFAQNTVIQAIKGGTDRNVDGDTCHG